MARQLHQDEPDSIPAHRAGRLLSQRPLILLQGALELSALEQEERQVESCGEERLRTLERPAECVYRVAARLRRPKDAQIVPGQLIRRVGAHSLLVGGERVSAPAGLMETHPPLVPQLGRVGVLGHERVVEAQGRADIPTQQMDLRHGLQVEAAILAFIEALLILAERVVVIALLPERDAEIVMGERSALN